MDIHTVYVSINFICFLNLPCSIIIYIYCFQWFNVLKYKFCSYILSNTFYYFYVGQQEYSSRQAAITSGIVLAVLIPLILLIAYLGYKVYKKVFNKDSSSWQYQKPPQNSQTFRRSLVPYRDEEYEEKSPIPSPSESDTIPKKRRSYEKSYRTHEPLTDRPYIGFEDKPLDPNDPTYDDIDRASRTPSSPTSPTSSIQYTTPYNPRPDIIQGNSTKNLNYTENDYSLPIKKPKNRFSQSQSSIVTDVQGTFNLMGFEVLNIKSN